MIKENEETFHTLINRYTCEMLTFLVFMIVGAKVLKADDEPCDNKGCDQDILLKECRNNPTLLLPHPGECQHLEECRYPLLSSTETLKCEQPGDVNCGERKELKDRCDYQREQCGSVHCYPCLLKYPSCIGKTDGLNGFPYRPNTPYYINCENQRLKSAGLVWENSVTGNQMFFIKNGCF
ncbi:unnamed protein product [Mytilus coruscus]|uniref:Uncharacterized protein n=1 Tax=Mytilus coruscus TaxID=42192 RepID=A0A6J8EMA4_MYTCO|nr:unnamed protein product [Mytilus coruscus]